MCKTTVIDNCGTYLTRSDKPTTGLNSQKRSLRYFIAVLPFVVVLLVSTSYQQNPEDLNYQENAFYFPGVVDSLKSFIATASREESLTTDSNNLPACQFVRKFYLQNGYKPIWIHFNGINDRAKSLVYMIEHAREYGLEPQNYHATDITGLIRRLEIKSETGRGAVIDFNLELLLTDAAFRLMINLHSGYLPLDSALFASEWVSKLPEILLNGITSGKVTENLQSVEPGFYEYSRLRKATEHYIRTNFLSNKNNEIDYPNKDTLILNSQIKEALIALGYLDRTVGDVDFTHALQVFQRYHGLEPDGKTGINTIEALRRNTLYCYRMLALNLDRLRKNQFSGSDILYVNIPAYRLKIFHQNSLMDTFRVIVGNPSSPTPLLSGVMERIIANPVWYVPKSIAINEMLPRIREDSNYLKKNGFRVLDKNYRVVENESFNLNDLSENNFDYTFRQSRGSDNSLGQLKFIFSNPYAVYLHDTPGRALFSKDLRAFSHGCIRVQHPERLAGYILSEINADTTNIAHLIATGQQREFKLTSPLPINITYVTCEADDKGLVFFYNDIYGIDGRELEALSAYMGI